MSSRRLLSILRRLRSPRGARELWRRYVDRRLLARLERTPLREQYRAWKGRLGRGGPRTSVARSASFRILALGGTDADVDRSRRSLEATGSGGWTLEREIPPHADPSAVRTFWIAIGAGDELDPGALDRFEAALREPAVGNQPTVLYGDEDTSDPSAGTGPFLKPAWSPTLALTLPARYPGLPTALPESVIAGLDPPPSPSAYWPDLVLRCTEAAHTVVHVPGPLLTRVKRPVDPVLGTMDERRALVRDALNRRGVPAVLEAGQTEDTLRVGATGGSRRVSVLLPTRDRPDLLRAVLETLDRVTDDVELEVVILDHETRDPEARDVLSRRANDPGVRVLRFDGPFNFSRLINRGAAEARYEHLLLLNNDVSSEREDWLSRLLSTLEMPGCAVVGPRLLYPDGSLQHAGIGLGIARATGHVYKGPIKASTPFVSPLVSREVAAVTGACLLVRTEDFHRVGGLDERNLPVSFSDVDLCLRLREEGGTVIYDAGTVLRHEETATRDDELDLAEIEYMRRRWGAALEEDPFLSPAWFRGSESPHLDPLGQMNPSPRVSSGPAPDSPPGRPPRES